MADAFAGTRDEQSGGVIFSEQTHAGSNASIESGCNDDAGFVRGRGIILEFDIRSASDAMSKILCHSDEGSDGGDDDRDDYFFSHGASIHEGSKKVMLEMTRNCYSIVMIKSVMIRRVMIKRMMMRGWRFK